MSDHGISINVDYTRKDFISAYLLICCQKNWRENFKFSLLPVLLICGYLTFVLSDASSINLNFLYYIFAMIILLLLLNIGSIVSYFSARRAFKNFNMRDLNNIVLSADRDGINEKTNVSDGHLDWEFFVEAFENHELIVVRLKSSQLFIFPKRCFSNAENIISFRELLKANVPEYKRVK